MILYNLLRSKLSASYWKAERHVYDWLSYRNSQLQMLHGLDFCLAIAEVSTLVQEMLDLHNSRTLSPLRAIE